MLLQAGAGVDLQSKEGGDAPSGWGQCTYRARRGDMLLQAGATVDLQSKGVRVDLQSKERGDAPSGRGWSGPAEQSGHCYSTESGLFLDISYHEC